MTDRQFRNEIVRRMKAVGVYRAEFEPTIKRLAELYVQCERIEKQFIDSGGETLVLHTNKFGATNAVENPYLSARDKVYSQLLEHERELGLTPVAMKKIGMSAAVDNRPQSALAAALEKLSRD